VKNNGRVEACVSIVLDDSGAYLREDHQMCEPVGGHGFAYILFPHESEDANVYLDNLLRFVVWRLSDDIADSVSYLSSMVKKAEELGAKLERTEDA
jgi:hypothetical protein